MCLLVDGDLNPLGDRKLDRVRLAEGERDVFALELGAVADTDDVELLLEAQSDALNSVGEKRASQAVQRAMLFVVANCVQHAVFLLEANLRRNQHAELALGALHFDLATADGTDLHAGGNWNRFATKYVTSVCFLLFGSSVLSS